MVGKPGPHNNPRIGADGSGTLDVASRIDEIHSSETDKPFEYARRVAKGKYFSGNLFRRVYLWQHRVGEKLGKGKKYCYYSRVTVTYLSHTINYQFES
ncbi:hypothetical protein CW304_13280 [Bacillus sp. UFRGS-B20]|nr:hypothetical protein CW304_13280 [Bacillus sp. UFRGS-B20]